MDKDRMEQLWPTVLMAIAKMSNGELIDQVEIFACKDFLTEINSLQAFMNEYLPKQIFGRSFRREDNSYILDEDGDYVSFRGMWGAVWYRPKNWTPGTSSGKFIGPFGG